MFEFEDMSSGFHDLFLNKYSDPTPIMDLYISDSMQDMLDIDIKSEVATVVGGVNEFSSLMNNELPSLEIGGDSNSNDCDNSAWLGGPKWSAVNTDIYADVGACVNPNSVMPVISSSSVNNTTNSAVASVASLLKSPKNQLDLNTNVMGVDAQMPSPRERKSHLTFSPNMIKIPMVKDALPKPSSLARTNNGIDSVKKDLIDDLKDIKYVQKPQKILSNSQLINNDRSGGSPSLVRTNGNTIKLAGGIGGLTFANSMQFNKLKQIQQKTLNGNFKRDRSSSPAPAQFQHNNNTSQQHMNNGTTNHTMNGANSPKMFSRINNATSQQTKLKQKPSGHEFPKPAYSYSCLIAMALKNSRSGSLPVSEIYSFMCEHFPYFKTAPNGWKNSVRHNLSLNKCFEKIEKPATNGGQRKGCLWAMNPSKIAKMDEEVQKWSRKDPMAIRKAMVFPEHLEALERGEMKHGSTGESDNENEGEENEEEQSDAEEIDNEVDETFINTPPESCEDEEPDVDFDVEVGEFYDDLSINTKEDILESISQKAFLSDISSLDDTSDLIIPMAKRPRLDLNYSITTTPTNGIVNGHLVSQKTGIVLNGTSNLSNGHLTQTTSHQLIGINQRRKVPLVNRVV